MPTDKKKTAQNKKVFDVSRPGKKPADASSRPVINNRKAIEDPDISTNRPLLNPKKKISVEPVESQPDSEPDKSTEPEKGQKPAGAPPLPEDKKEESPTKTESAKPDKPDSKQPKPEMPEISPEKPEPKSEPAAQPISEQQKDEEAESIGKAAIDESLVTVSEQAQKSEPIDSDHLLPSGSKPKADSTNREPAEPMHMDLPKEFSPGKAIVSQHSHRTLWLEILSILLILLLIAAIANLLLDAGIITTEFDVPYTDFFRDI